MKTLCCSLLVPFACAAWGQSTVQFRIDTTIADYAMLEQGVVTPDGAVWTVLNVGDGKALWKCDAQGTPLWAITLDSVDQYSYITALPYGGCAVVNKLLSQHLLSGGPIDTMLFGFTLTVLHADGSLNWRRKVTAKILYGGSSLTTGLRLLACRPGAGGSLMVLTDIALNSGGATSTPHVFKFDANGALLWSKKMGAPYLNTYLRWAYGVRGVGGDGVRRVLKTPAPKGHSGVLLCQSRIDEEIVERKRHGE